MNLFERAMEHSWGRWVWFLSFLALAVYVLSGIEISSPPPSPQLSTTALDSRSLNERQMHDALGIGTQTIASLRVGDRVLAVNPQVTAEERASYVEPDWNDWLQISLVLPKPDGSNLEIEILRPDDWFIEHYSLEVHPAETVANKKQAELFEYSLATQATTFPFPSLPNFAFEFQQQSGSYGQASPTLKDEEIVSTSGVPLRPAFAELERQLTLAANNGYEPVCLAVQMDLPEMGLTGEAIVTNIRSAPAVKPGNGRVVTATFKHSSGDCINLALSSDGTAETIGTTSNHPFWSVDRQDYVQAGSLQLDERVQTYSGDTKRVISKLARPGPEAVYNLEVHAEHVYYVGQWGVLVHNTQQYGLGAPTKAGFEPSDFGLTSIADNPTYHRLWTDALSKAAAWGGRKNAYQKLLMKIEAGDEVSGKELSKAFGTVRGYFQRLAKEEGIDIPAGDIHHWNFSKSNYPRQVLDPRNLFPTRSDIQHKTVHFHVGNGKSVDFNAPTRADSVLKFDDTYYPLPANYFKK